MVWFQAVENLPGCGVGVGVDQKIKNVPALGGVPEPVFFKELLEFFQLSFDRPVHSLFIIILNKKVKAQFVRKRDLV